MKDFFKKHDLFKILGICMVVAALLTWILRYAVFQGTELMTFDEEVKGLPGIFDTSTIGLFDFHTYPLLVLYYFTNIFIFIFVVFAFYKILGKTKKYERLVSNVGKMFEGKELVFIILSMVFYTVLASIVNDYFILLAFIPFTLSILNRLKVDKISSLVTTFGSTMVGVLAATYSNRIVGTLISTAGFNMAYANELLAHIILAVVSLAALVLLILPRLNNKKLEVVKDLFVEEQKPAKKKYINVIPLAFFMVIFAVIILLAFMPWSTWQVTFFDDLYKSITEATIFGYTIPAVVLGQTTFVAFGQWDLFTISAFMMLTIIVYKFVANISIDEIIEGTGEGLKLALKPLALVAMIYTVLVFSVSFPVIPQIVVGIGKLFSAEFLRPINWFLSGLVTSTFVADFQYFVTLTGTYFAGLNPTEVVAIALKASYAFAGFIAPTSIMLMLGLSTLDIKYSEYFKFIWKFLIALLAITLVVLYILLYI
jgi:uncharacterized ion transporter superfamily protein YfcC